ncbi:MAG: ArsC/Spx/MgsR family protein [Paracoccaceae bacterium]|nr:ArsC/Spx/MgsR family protein [Paracoccaceae bacterium]
MTLFGLKTCDTCRKALKALREAGQDVEFVDLREGPVPPDLFAMVHRSHGGGIVNRRSRTWAGLTEGERGLPPEELVARHPAVMKRPVIRAGDRIYLGWTEAVRAALLS